MSNVIALFSSSRRHGNTGQFMDRIAAELGVEVVDLAGKRIAPYDYEHRNRDDEFEALMQRVLTFERVIFATPVYWYAASPAMKTFLDRIADFLELPDLVAAGRQLRGKRAYVVCTSIYEEVPQSFLSAFLDTFSYLGMTFGGVAHVDCRDGYSPARHDAAAVAFARQLRDASQ